MRRGWLQVVDLPELPRGNFHENGFPVDFSCLHVVVEVVKHIVNHEAEQCSNLPSFSLEGVTTMNCCFATWRAIRAELVPIIAQERISNEVGKGMWLGRVEGFTFSRLDVPLPHR